ncbi:MAG: hypothetical protein LIO65_07950 [Odoribacter sp.]|nr:hypothetical protein [Odoribacter sp.]
MFNTRIVDEDNLVSEQIINNLSLFFTEPSSATITHKFIYTGFSISGAYQIVTLPLEADSLLTKDIYVVANYNNESTLEAMNTVADLRTLLTPEVDKTNNLNPANGFCMFGTLANFDFNNTTNTVATVPLTRTCAKLRISLRFPEATVSSTNNSFLIQHAAAYTYVIDNPSLVLPQSDYFNFAAALPLTDNGQENYTAITYVYDANEAPIITLYAYINNSTTVEEFTATLPIPQRNYLYDITVQVFEEEDASTRNSLSAKKSNYKHQITITTYNEKGEIVE